MTTRRPIYKKVIDVFTLLLVGLYAASMTTLPFRVDPWAVRAFGVVLAIGADYWFFRLVLAVRYLWTGREIRIRDALRRPVRSAG